MFDPERTDLGDVSLVAEAIGLLDGGTRTIAAGPFIRPDGEPMLGAYAFPRAFDWAILVEKRQRDAYLAIERMIDSLLRWTVVGLAVAGAGALALAFRISRPIVEIDRVAGEVAKGNFQARVTGVRSHDEIGELARRMDDMVVGLNERFHLQKFVSRRDHAGDPGLGRRDQAGWPAAAGHDAVLRYQGLYRLLRTRRS